MANQTIYTFGGTVQAGNGIYIPRRVDDELLQLCRQSEFAFVLSSRQVGKSSLMVRTAQQLENEGIRSAIIDLSSIGAHVSQDEWYVGILHEISNTINFETNIFTWWNEHKQLGPAQRLTIFFREVLLKEIKEHVVLFFDEIDSTLSLPFSSDDFFAAVRAAYNTRSTIADFKRLSFVMIGVATPSDLISDSNRTPFNIGHRVDLTDFSLEEALPLASELGAQTLAWVFHWTGGHPYLTQRLCAHLSTSKVKLTEEVVGEVVRHLFEGEQGWQDTNLQFVRDKLIEPSPYLSRMLKTYKDIRTGTRVTDDERSIIKSRLKISGVVRSHNGFLLPRNRIYKNIFSTTWAQENIPRNWQKVALISISTAFVLLLFSILAIFINDYQISKRIPTYVGEFVSATSPAQRLSKLSAIYQEKSILSSMDSNLIASQLFYSLSSAEEQLDIFKAYEINRNPDLQNDLVVVISHLSITVANISPEGDNTELLQIMHDSLRNVSENQFARNLENEIADWLDGRKSASIGDYEAALVSYNKALSLNSINHAVLYERAKVYVALGQYANALQDLDNTLGFAKKSAPDITTSTPITDLPPVSLTSGTNEVLVVESGTPPFGEATLPSEAGLTPTESIPPPILLVQTPTPPIPLPIYFFNKKFESNFTTLIDVVNAVKLLIEKNPQLQEFFQSSAENLYTNLQSYNLVSKTFQTISCTPDSPEANVYKAEPEKLAITIFEYLYPPTATPASPDGTVIALPTPPSDQQIRLARYEAFQYLTKQTKRWSTIETVKLDDLNEMQITVTFIHPELLQAIFLNEVLKDRFLTSGFEDQLKIVLDSIAAREELLFLVTVTATSNNNPTSIPRMIEIPIKQMVLKNAGNLETTPVHDDHNLEQPINSSLGAVFGFIAYPLGLLDSNGCVWTLDPKYNTNIVITLPDIKIDNVSSSKYTWTIPYKSLIDPSPPVTPQFAAPTEFALDRVWPSSKPPYPLPSFILSAGTDSNAYWEEFAKFIWSQVTLGNY